MASPAVSGRLRYLDDSAHLLAMTAPSTSAYLMSRHNSLISDNELEQTDAHRQHVCGACGSIMIMGWTGAMQFETLKSGKRRHNGKSVQEGSMGETARAVTYKCDLCGRQTRLSINNSVPKSKNGLFPRLHPKSQQSDIDLSTFSPYEQLQLKPPNPTLANTNSRKRAKLRKQGGLQALLAKNKEAGRRKPLSGFGLDLLDMMKEA